MYIILNLIVAGVNLFGLFLIFNGLTIPTETSIHQIYTQLIILTGTILFASGLICATILHFTPSIKNLEKNIKELNELSKQVSDDFLYEEYENKD